MGNQNNNRNYNPNQFQHYQSSQRNIPRTAFDNNGAPERKMMENFRDGGRGADGSERFDNYRVKNTVSRWDSNTLQKRRQMENYRDGTDRFGSNGGYDYDDPRSRPVPYATRPKKDYSRTRSVSENFTNGDPRGYEYNNRDQYNTNPRVYGTRPSPKESVRREMNSISRTLYNGESQLPEYTRYPDAPPSPYGNRNLPKLVATRPKPDQKYKTVTRHLNGQTPKPLVDPTKPRNPSTMSTYNSNQLPGYDDGQEKRYGGTSAPL